MLTYSTLVYIYVRLHVDLLDQLPVLSNLQRWLTEIGKPLEHDKKINVIFITNPFPTSSSQALVRPSVRPVLHHCRPTLPCLDSHMYIY